MANKRVYYAIRRVGIGPYGSPNVTSVHGLQEATYNGSINLNQVFEIGQLAIYDTTEDVPEIELTLEKVLDGYAPVYTLATQQAANPTLAGRSNTRCNVAFDVYDETKSSAYGTSLAQIKFSGMYVSSISYNFPLDGEYSESVTLVGNDMRVVGQVGGTRFAYTDNPFVSNDDQPLSIGASGGVNRRHTMMFEYKPTGTGTFIGRDENGAVSGLGTVLPPDIPGISPSGTNDKVAGEFKAHIGDITVSADLGREQIFEQGRKAPYYRYVTFPVEVTTEINVIATSGALVSLLEEGRYGSGCGTYNTKNRTIKIHICEGLLLHLGKRNRLSNISIGGGGTGGDNLTVTYSYTNQNDLIVLHPKDPNWTNTKFQYKTHA